MSKKNEIKVVRMVRPDDVRVGDYVMVMHVSYDYVTMSCGVGSDGLTVQRLTVVPNETAPPVRIESACVPFVMVRSAKGKSSMVDMRRVQLGRVSNVFGRAVFASTRAASKKKAAARKSEAGRK